MVLYSTEISCRGNRIRQDTNSISNSYDHLVLHERIYGINLSNRLWKRSSGLSNSAPGYKSTRKHSVIKRYVNIHMDSDVLYFLKAEDG